MPFATEDNGFLFPASISVMSLLSFAGLDAYKVFAVFLMSSR